MRPETYIVTLHGGTEGRKLLRVNDMALRYDVVVVGGGVAGSYAAAFLAKAGFKVALIEMKDEEKVGEKTCGDAVGAHHFAELGLEPPTLGIDGHSVYEGVKVISPDERHAITVNGKGYALNRKAFGLRLFRSAVNSGADAYLAHVFTKPIIEGSWIRGVIASDRAGRKIEFLAKVIIDATGATAAVRNSLPTAWWVSEPIPKEDFNVTYREVVIGDINVEREYAYIYLNVEVAPGGYWWLFPKGSGIYNIGVGIQLKKRIDLGPRERFERYIRPRIKNRVTEVVDAGGGLVPTRRPLPCMVWNGLLVIGDAATTANPIHGGGIGSALISAREASEVVVGALTRGEPTMENMWELHERYHRAYGAKQASLDVLRMFLQRLSNDALNYIFNSKLVEGVDVYDIGAKGSLNLSIFERLRALLSLSSRPAFLLKLYKLKQYMDEARRLYLEYPKSPQYYPQWRRREETFFREYASWLRQAL